MDVDLLVLNYNGRRLMEECLPSLLEAAARSRHTCRVSIVDNGSTDDSLSWLSLSYPRVRVIRCANEGLCSFNRVLAASTAPVAILLNNDIRLAVDSIDPLVAPFEAQLCQPTEQGACFMVAPLCWQWDGRTLEGFQTAVRWRTGLVQATGRFEGAETICHQSGETAAAGAAIAVDRAIFLHLGGFDPRYLPGRIEDLDFAFRGFMAGYRAVYVPDAVAWHRGAASFGPEFGDAGCLRLAYRNTLLFQWRHLRHPIHTLRQSIGIPLRIAADVCRAPVTCASRRWLFTKAFFEALRLHRRLQCKETAELNHVSSVSRRERLARERAYFRRFHPAVLLERAAGRTDTQSEAQRDRRHPISRWYLLPVMNRLAVTLAGTVLRPWHFTVAGLLCILAAVAALVAGLTPAWVAASLVWIAWACDRLDGKLARRQGSATPQGAWLDANVDELCDLAIHVGMAWAASAAAFTTLVSSDALGAGDLPAVLWPWLLAIAFIVGKYLLFYGKSEEAGFGSEQAPALVDQEALSSGESSNSQRSTTVLRTLYHLPGNADVRWHVVIVALAGGWFQAALVYAACYFNLRWMLRAAKLLSPVKAPLRHTTKHLAGDVSSVGPANALDAAEARYRTASTAVLTTANAAKKPPVAAAVAASATGGRS